MLDESIIGCGVVGAIARHGRSLISSVALLYLQLAVAQQSNASVQNAVASFNQKLEEQVYSSLKLKYVAGQFL